MEAQNKDEGKTRQREEMLARRVGEALDRMNPAGSGRCPEPDVIAAYSDQALDSAEFAQCESHFATCERCRKVLRVLAVSADTPLAEKEVAHLGELALASRGQDSPSASVAKPARPSAWDWRVRVRWLAPALGAVAVLAVWFAIRPPWRGMGQGAKPTLVAQARKDETPASVPVDQASRLAPEEALESRRAAPENKPSPKSPPKPALFESESRLPESPAPTPPPARAKAMEALPGAQLGAGAAGDAARQVLPAESSPVSPAAAASANAALSEKKSQPPQPPSAAGAVTAAELSRQFEMKAQKSDSIAPLKAFSGAPISATSPFGSIIWRASGGGQIEYSADAGQTWTSQISPVHEDWLAGAAVSDTVCWLAGRNGAIARTTDGERWERIQPPQPAGGDGKMPDWMAITALNAQSATVTARDGRRFGTKDGGKTWQPQ